MTRFLMLSAAALLLSACAGREVAGPPRSVAMSDLDYGQHELAAIPSTEEGNIFVDRYLERGY